MNYRTRPGCWFAKLRPRSFGLLIGRPRYSHRSPLSSSAGKPRAGCQVGNVAAAGKLRHHRRRIGGDVSCLLQKIPPAGEG